jgi:hypothetical protein
MRTQPLRISLKRQLLAGSILALVVAAGPSFAKPWSFGVISDTQWTKSDDGYNPNTVAANIIKQIDQQFIAASVDLVVAVGDTENDGNETNIGTRALYAQRLYNAGIGFYPVRGNHEVHDKNSGFQMRAAFPQIVAGPDAGVNNNTPVAFPWDGQYLFGTPITAEYLILEPDLTNNPPAKKEGVP